MQVKFRKSFEKDLGKLRDKTLLQRIKAVIAEVETAVSLEAITNIKKLQAEGRYYRIKVGNYRIGITVDGSLITFVRVLHRKEIYRYFP